MKKITYLFIVLFAFCLTACGEKQPETTYETDAPTDVHYPNFATVKKKTKYDANRLCKDGWSFRVTKNAGANIVSTDVCDHCDHMWYVHEEK